MHTASQLSSGLFSVSHRGRPSSRDELLPEWGTLDRLGVVMTEPYGAVGASHLIQLAITAFYDVKPIRRAGRVDDVDPRSVYPEIYLFHVGGSHGDLMGYDFAPHRKEVFLDAEPRAVLNAINDRGITRLAVPDGQITPVVHHHKEPSAALDRIVSAFAYSPTGRVSHPDWEIAGLDGRTEANVRFALDREMRERATAGAREPLSDPVLEAYYWRRIMRSRLDEASESLPEARARREAIRNEHGFARESYRSITVEEALASLV